MSCDNILDDPVTPAPVFAFRALRGVLFGSPETPFDREDSNKENTSLINIEAHKKTTTTEKSARGDSPRALKNKQTPTKKQKTNDKIRSTSESGNMARQLNRSPKSKQHAKLSLVPIVPQHQGDQVVSALVSPTKSILRVPGQATPRAQSLRDINVTFKSLSPDESIAARDTKTVEKWPPLGTATRRPDHYAAAELVNNGKPATNGWAFHDIPAATGTRQPAQSHSTAVAMNNDQPASNVSTTNSIPAATSPANGISAAAFEAYQKQTEKEMRRLIKYGQQMKEFAYQSDMKNQQLSEMIARLQAENEKLRKESAELREQMDTAAGLALSPGACGNKEADAPTQPHAAAGGLYVPVFHPDVAACIEKNRRRDRAPLVAPPLPPSTKPDSALARHYAGMDNFLSLDPSRGGVPPLASDQQIADAWIAREKEVDLEAVLKEGEEIANAPEDSEFKKQITHPKVYAANKLRAALNAPSAGLPAERSAAARERLARKSEARKASREA